MSNDICKNLNLNNTQKIGIEIGSLYFKAVGLGEEAKTIWRIKKKHQGRTNFLVQEFLQQAKIEGLPVAVACRNSLEGEINRIIPSDCLYTLARTQYPEAGNILEVGGSQLTLIRLDENNNIVSLHTNSLCAAGTGSFLDTQAERMGISYESMGGSDPDPNPPAVATRCAVFAKSDLAHLQQEGYSKQTMWSGLCRGLVECILRSLTKGKPLTGKTLLCGGVVLNQTFLWWLKQKLAENKDTTALITMPDPEFAVAIGAALCANSHPIEGTEKLNIPSTEPDRKRRLPLRLKRSHYPQSQVFHKEKDCRGNEITLHCLPGRSGNYESVLLGIDIGSTSTKLALVDESGSIILDVYRRTRGNPIQATKKLFNAVLDVERKYNLRFDVKAAATTGSGRKIIGEVINSDLIINEISAHVAGVVAQDPTAETVFEIGGQDAKFMSIKDGRTVDANMNYVCAAGTGSFVEELSETLGYKIDDLGNVVEGVAPPYTSSRCTVFMEQDAFNLLHRDLSSRDIAGAVVYSVIENYMERVVGNRPLNPQRIFFLGATARNRGLVAAIENICGTEVVVSPYCHVMGAYGAALLAGNKILDQQSGFRGFALAQRRISVKKELCTLCVNKCTLSRALIEGEPNHPAWGMKCGREENEPKKRFVEEFQFYQKVMSLTSNFPSPPSKTERPTVALSRALMTFSFFSFWKAFFDALDIPWYLGNPTDEQCIMQGNEQTASEVCLPLKAAYGQIFTLLNENQGDLIFVPHLLADYPSPPLTHTRFCPYIEALPALIRSALSGDEKNSKRFISPVIDLSLSDEKNAKSLAKALSPFYSLSVSRIKIALHQAHRSRKKSESQLREIGLKAMERQKQNGRPTIVIIGRPYNTLDEKLNHDIPHFIAQLGFHVLPMVCLPWDPALLTGEFQNLFWSYGQRIISVLMQIAETEGLYAVYLSNFGCGPDSFLLNYAETIMGEKPFLVLELDEHGSSGGYQTRVEAFLDVVAADWQEKKVYPQTWKPPRCSSSHEDLTRRTIWIPPMHEVGCRLFAAVFRGHGLDAKCLPQEDEASFSLGKSKTRGSECLPAPLTLGAFLKQIGDEDKSSSDSRKKHALFMPTSDGPCRFGQYRTLCRMVLDQMDHQDIPILSPGAHNAYYGLERGLRKNLWETIVASDILFKMRCRVLPYELTAGDTMEILEKWIRNAEERIENGKIDWTEFLHHAVNDFLQVPRKKEERPLVGVVGEIYVRCNDFANSGVIEDIEEMGGEAWLSPVSEWILYTAWMERYLDRHKRHRWKKSVELGLKWKFLARKEHLFYRAVESLLFKRKEPPIAEIIRSANWILPTAFEGESILTIGRAILFQRDGADLVVNCAPFGCMHGNITTAIFEQMRQKMEIPVVNMVYDGVEDNTLLGTYMHALRMDDRSAGRNNFF
jgi:predicted CoA-substrate-specific enzyme activase